MTLIYNGEIVMWEKTVKTKKENNNNNNKIKNNNNTNNKNKLETKQKVMSFKYYVEILIWIRSTIFTKWISATDVVLMFMLSVLLQFQTSALDLVLCPPYNSYLESGNVCVFILHTCGNHSYSREQCNQKIATLVSFISSELYLKKLCEFAQKRVSGKSSFFLGAHRENGIFVWDYNNAVVSFSLNTLEDRGYDCLEINVIKLRCYLMDTPCNKQTYPLCVYTHVNPCLYDNGGCEGDCVPRHMRERICKCSPNYKAVGTTCVSTDIQMTCPHGTVYTRGLCIARLSPAKPYYDHHTICGTHMNTLILSLTNRDQMETYCVALRELYGVNKYYFVAGAYNKWRESINWFLRDEYMVDPEMCLPLGDVSNVPQFNQILLKVNTESCCFKIGSKNTPFEALCDIAPPDKCQHPGSSPLNCLTGQECFVKSGYRQAECKKECPPGFTPFDRKCDDIDECNYYNGGCQHWCKNTIGSRECYCWDGYVLNNDTECDFVDKCLTNQENNECPAQVQSNSRKHQCPSDKDNNEVDYDDDDYKIGKGHYSSTVWWLLVFLGMFICSVSFKLAYFAYNKQRGRDSEYPKNSTKDRRAIDNDRLPTDDKVEETVFDNYELVNDDKIDGHGLGSDMEFDNTELTNRAADTPLDINVEPQETV